MAECISDDCHAFSIAGSVYCNKHYHSLGPPDEVIPKRFMCSRDDCTDPVHDEGLCRGHWGPPDEPEDGYGRLDDPVDHPAHYGSEDNPYEVIKVIDAWRLDFCLGNAVKYIARAGKKDPTKTIEDLKKAQFYLNHEIEKLEKTDD